MKFKLIIILLLLSGITKSQTDSVKTTKQEPFIFVDQMPQFPGGQNAMTRYLSANIKYPDIARDNNIQGTVYYRFIVRENGKVSDVSIIRGIGGGCDEEGKRIVQAMPDWIPGKQNGKEVAVQFNLPIKFKLNEDTLSKPRIISSDYFNNAPDYIITDKKENNNIMDIKPSFPGGESAMWHYIQDNLNYPQQANGGTVYGDVTVRFLVDADGTIKDVTVMKGIGGGCDQEAVRVIELMKEWIPAKRSGKNIAYHVRLNVTFKKKWQNKTNKIIKKSY